MKLYYKAGACSLASHIVLREVGLDHEIEPVDTDSRQTGSGRDFREINPNGYVPALELPDGGILTEGAAILQYLAEQKPGLYCPAGGTVEKARLQEYLNYVASELHKAFGPLFSASADEAEKSAAIVNVGHRFDYVEALLADGRDYLLDGGFSVADTYLFVVSNWANFTGIDLTGWPRLKAFVERIAARPAVRSAMRAEGLIS